jgi:hypothetical protein
MTVSVVIVNKTGVLKDRTIKQYDETVLYKEAGFKSGDGFALQTIWKKESINRGFSVSLYAKVKGKAGQENKYDFPPPVDSVLYFGSCLLIATSPDGSKTDLHVKDWIAIYEHLFGGFEDIGSQDSEEESEDDLSDPDVPRTKEGYVKDGFIVDDEDEEDDDEEEEEEYVEPKPKRKARVSSSKKEPKEKKEKNEIVSNANDTPESSYLECTSELSEEAYFE